MSKGEWESCIERFNALYECGLTEKPIGATVESFFRQSWLPLTEKGYKPPSGFQILSLAFGRICGGFEYPECGPDIEEIKIVLESLSRVSLGKFAPQSIQIDLDNANEFYTIEFEWKSRKFKFKCLADPDFVPETEIVAEINRILETTEVQERFIGITPPPPTETAGYIFAAPPSVRAATKCGLIWSNI